MSDIEGVSFDVDGEYDSRGVARGWYTIILEGDFTDAIDRYLKAEEGDFNYSHLCLGITPELARELIDKIGRYV